VHVPRTNESAARKAEAQLAEDRQLYDKVEAQVAAREAELTAAITASSGKDSAATAAPDSCNSVGAASATTVGSVASAVHNRHRLSPQARCKVASELNSTWPGRSSQLASLAALLAPAAEVAPAAASSTDPNDNHATTFSGVQNSSGGGGEANKEGTMLGLSGCSPLVVQGPPGQGKRGLLRAVLDAYCVRHVWVNVDRVIDLYCAALGATIGQHTTSFAENVEAIAQNS